MSYHHIDEHATEQFWPVVSPVFLFLLPLSLKRVEP